MSRVPRRIAEHIGQLGLGRMFDCCSIVAAGRILMGEEGRDRFLGSWRAAKEWCCFFATNLASRLQCEIAYLPTNRSRVTLQLSQSNQRRRQMKSILVFARFSGGTVVSASMRCASSPSRHWHQGY